MISTVYKRSLTPKIRLKKQFSRILNTKSQSPNNKSQLQTCIEISQNILMFDDYHIQQLINIIDRRINQQANQIVQAIKAASFKWTQDRSPKVKSRLRYLRNRDTIKQLDTSIGQVLKKHLDSNNDQQQVNWAKFFEEPQYVIPKQVTFPVNYYESEDIVIDLYLVLINFDMKIMTRKAIALQNRIEMLKTLYVRQLTDQKKAEILVQLLPLMIIFKQFKQCQWFFDQKLTQNVESRLDQQIKLFQCISDLAQDQYYKKIQLDSFESNFQILQKIAKVYLFYRNCNWNKLDRSLSFLKQQKLKDWSYIINADFKFKTEVPEQCGAALFLLQDKIDQRSSLYYIACLMSLRYYSQNKSTVECLSFVSSINENYLKPDQKARILSYKIKYQAITLKQVSIQFNQSILLRYQYAKAHIKYSLKHDQTIIKQYLESVIQQLALLKQPQQTFQALFWLCILHKKLGFHKLAVSQAQQCLNFNSNDEYKIAALRRYINTYQEAKDALKSIFELPNKKQLIKKVSKFDKYCGMILMMMIEQPGNNKLYFQLLKERFKFEGYFINWWRHYKLTKNFPKKCYDCQQDNFQANPSHPLFIIQKIRQRFELIELFQNKYFGIEPEILWQYTKKQFAGIGLHDTVLIMYTKSLTCESASKLLQDQLQYNCHFIINYYLAKCAIQLQEYQSAFNNIDQVIRQTNGIYKGRSLYLKSEIYFILKDYKVSQKFYNECLQHANQLGDIQFLQKSKRKVSKVILEDYLSNSITT